MTSFTRTWNAAYEATPADSAAFSEGANRIRDLKSDVQERGEVDHSWAGDAADGAHKKVTLIEQASDPSSAANTGFIYSKDVGGVTELFYEDSGGTVLQLTTAGAISLASGQVTATELAANSVDSSELVNGSIDSGHFAAGAVDATAIGADAVGSSEIAANAVGNSEMADNAIDMAELAHKTQGDILIYGASGVPAVLAIGTSGKVLQSNGAGADPSWESLPAATVYIPSTTKCLFQQTAAPTGYTKDTTHDNKALRLVNGSVSTGGATAFTSVFGSGKTTGSHVLSTAEMPSHTHTVPGKTGGSGSFFSKSAGTTDTTVTSNATGGGGGHTHTESLDLQYVDIIIATKD